MTIPLADDDADPIDATSGALRREGDTVVTAVCGRANDRRRMGSPGTAGVSL